MTWEAVAFREDVSMWTWIVSEIVLIPGVVLAVLAIAHMLRQRRSPQSAIAWFVVMALLPYVGVPAYLLFGRRKLPRRHARKMDIRLTTGPVFVRPQAASIERLLTTIDIPPATAGNRVTLLTTGEEAYRVLIETIEGAKERIEIAMFILGRDAVAREVIQKLAERARAGVQVRVLIDAVGSLYTGRRALRPLLDAGVRVARFMPVFRQPFRGRAHLRNHRKIVVADGERVIAGGMNIAQDYIGPAPDPGRWRDIAFLLEGPATAHYAEVFRSDWAFTTGETLPPPRFPPVTGEDGNAIVQVVPSGPDAPGDPIYVVLLTSAFAARERLWIVTPYFIPNEAAIQALCIAARRGVDVRILVPDHSNHPITDLARGSYLREVQAAGGTVLRYTGNMVHAKAFLMDDEVAMLGSANMDMRGLFLDYEVGVLLYSEAEIRATEQWMKELFLSTAKGVAEPHLVRDLLESVVRMLSPVL